MRLFLASFFVFLLVGALALAVVIRIEGRDLPSTARLHAFTPTLKTRVLDRNDALIGEFVREDRTLVRLEDIPKPLVDAFLCVEDRRFWDHWGVDLAGVARAATRNLSSGHIRQGASTLTQQLARNLFLTHEQTLSRKVKEAVLALRIEQTYSKEEILELYLNQIYFGEGAYGVKAAAGRIFGKKDLTALTLSEMATLAGLPRNPRDYSPRRHPDRARQRRAVVLASMEECGLITAAERAAAEAESIHVGSAPLQGAHAPYFMEMVRQFLESRYGSSAIYDDGLTIRTTLDLALQEEAERALEEHLRKLEKDFRIRRTRAAWESSPTRPEEGPQYLQGASITLDVGTGEILSLIGGRDFAASPFNRAVQARRQPGSAMKPFVFLAGIRHGFYPSYVIVDEPVSYPQPGRAPWTPQNYDRDYNGPVTLRYALQKSLNIPTIKLQEMFGPEEVVEVARAAGIVSPLPAVRSLALGTGEVTLEEITCAYAAFANEGIRVEPWFITKIEDRAGNLIEEFRPEKSEVLPAGEVALLVDMMTSVMDHGTGYKAREAGFTLPAAGKTGTTDDYSDAWFIGFTPKIVTGVWVGFDEKKPIAHGVTGSVGALPIWTRVMQAATRGQEPAWFTLAPGMTRIEVCPQSRLPAGPFCPSRVSEIYPDGRVPEGFCRLHTSGGG